IGSEALAVYRDGSKQSQPLSTSTEEDKKADSVKPVPRRERLNDTRQSLTHKFSVQGHEGYLNVGLYENGRPGELFITMAKEGSTIGGLMDSFGTAISMSLQYGVPLEVLVNKFSHTRFDPMGFTKNPDIRYAKSVVDYIFRWMGCQFIPGYREANLGQPVESDSGGKSSGDGGDGESETLPVAKKADGLNTGQGATIVEKSNGSAPTANGSANGHGGHATASPSAATADALQAK
ncbi:unnamed protein product, partial [marine sediment metagenome]